jgi:uncharacterized membrane protein (UPF0127 family)
MDNATRRGLLTRHRQSQFPGSILDVFKAHDQGIDLIGEFEQQQMQVAQTPQQQQQGLRPAHQAGNVNQSMTFPNVPPNTPFNTMGMKAPIDIKKFNEQGHLVKSYDNVPPGVQNLPTGPQRGTVIETPANMQFGGQVDNTRVATPQPPQYQLNPPPQSPYRDQGTITPDKSSFNAWRDEDSLFENTVEFFDPTGITSWDDARRAYNSMKNRGTSTPNLDEGLDMFGAIPLFGKANLGINLAKGAAKRPKDVVNATKKGYNYLTKSSDIINRVDAIEDEVGFLDPKQRGTVIETSANMQSGGEVKKYQAGAFLAAGIGIGKAVIKTAKQRIADNIYPVGYRGEFDNPADRLYNAVIKNEPEPGSKKNSDQEGNGRTKHNALERQNILAYAMGQPNTLQESQYKPTKSKNSDAVYYRSPRTEWNLENELTMYASRGEGLNLIDTYSNSDPGYHDSKTKASSDAINVLGNYTIDKGEDSRGKYISYYDKWDLDPFPGNTKLSSTIQKGIGIKAPEMYGRIYYDPKTGAPISNKKDIPFNSDSKYLKKEASSIASKTKTNMQGGGVIPGMQQYAQYNNLNPELAAAAASRPQNNDRLTSSTDAQMRQFNNRGEQTRVNSAQTNVSNRLSTAGSNAYQFHKDKPLDALGMDLAIAGQLPIVGEVADLANAGISGARGLYNTAVGDTAKAKEQFTLAGLSAASAIPFAGNAVGAARIAKAGHNISHKAHTLEKGVIGAKAFKASAYESKQTGGFKGSDLASAMKVGAGAAVTSTVGRGISALAKNRNLDKDAFAQWKAGQDRAHQAMLGMDYDEYCLTGDCPENPFQGDPPNFKDWRNHDYFSASQTNARPVGRLVQGFEDKPLQGKSILKQGVRDGIVTGALTYGTNKLLDNTRFGRKVKRNFNVKVGWEKKNFQAGGVPLDYRVAQELAKRKGNTPEFYLASADTMGYHESGPNQRMAINALQEPTPTGRGTFQIEGKDGSNTLETSQKHLKRTMGYWGETPPQNIMDSRDAAQLTYEEQRALALAHLLQGPAFMADYASGKSTLAEVWATGWKKKFKTPEERQVAINKFNASRLDAKKKGIPEPNYIKRKLGGIKRK